MVSSTLCVDCLAACEIGVGYRDKEIERLKEKIRRQQDLIRHLFKAYKESMETKGGESWKKPDGQK